MNCPHHVTPRGSHREDVFFCEANRQRYSAFGVAGHRLGRGGIIWLLAVQCGYIWGASPPNPPAFSALGPDGRQRKGKVREGLCRSFSEVPRDVSICITIGYTERQPPGLLKAHMWPSPGRGLELPDGHDSDVARGSVRVRHSGPLPAGNPHETARRRLSRVERIRSHTHTGRPAGDETFVDRLESLLRPVLRPKKAGRPRNVGSVPNGPKISRLGSRVRQRPLLEAAENTRKSGVVQKEVIPGNTVALLNRPSRRKPVASSP